MVQKVAPRIPVLIHGESGTKGTHRQGSSRKQPQEGRGFFCRGLRGSFRPILLKANCSATKKGAFTGANKNKDGIFKLAHRGTVFLDKISNVSLEIQGKLLRFLETREFLPLGAASIQKVDIRVILATNRDLKKMVEEGQFREDFYYRIYVYPISLPPLRDRKSDIAPYRLSLYLEQFNKAMGKQIKGFDREAARQLSEYNWPGNIGRQLRNMVERAVISVRCGIRSAPENCTLQARWATSRRWSPPQMRN